MKSRAAIIAITILLLAAIGGGGYWYWLRTPQYSMSKLAEAIKKHDGATFQTYFETKVVATNAVNDLSTEELRQVGGPRLLRRFLGIAVVQGLNPQMTEALANSINNYVSKTPEQVEAEKEAKKAADDERNSQRGPFGRLVTGLIHKVVDAIKPPPLREVLAEMGLTRDNYRGLTAFETNGQLCHVGLVFQPPDKPDKITVMLELENMDDHWHVIRISNMDALSRILTASESP